MTSENIVSIEIGKMKIRARRSKQKMVCVQLTAILCWYEFRGRTGIHQHSGGARISVYGELSSVFSIYILTLFREESIIGKCCSNFLGGAPLPKLPPPPFSFFISVIYSFLSVNLTKSTELTLFSTLNILLLKRNSSKKRVRTLTSTIGSS